MLSYLESVVHTKIKRALCLFKSGITVGPQTSMHLGSTLSSGGGTIEIGRRCKLHKGVILAAYGGTIKLGDNVSVNPYSVLYGHGGLEIGNNTRIAAHVVIVPDEHNYKDKNTPIRMQKCASKGIVIEEDVWIGAGVKILDGAHISKGCVIGAGAVIKGKTEPYGVYAGVPAKKINERT